MYIRLLNLEGLNYRKGLQETGLRRPLMNFRTGSTRAMLTQFA